MGVSMRFGETGSARAERPQILQLWSNPGTTASFGAQTVDLSGDLRHFDFILVEYVYSTGAQNVWSKMFRSAAVRSSTCVLPINDTSTSTGRRTFSAASVSSISFSAATFGGSTANSQIIPVGIYGIKL